MELAHDLLSAAILARGTFLAAAAALATIACGILSTGLAILARCVFFAAITTYACSILLVTVTIFARSLVFAAVAFVVGALVNGSLGVAAGVSVASALAALTIYLVIRLSYGSWSRKRLAQFDGLLDQIELIARSAPAAEPPSRAAEPLLDLDALEDELDTRTRPRGRARS